MTTGPSESSEPTGQAGATERQEAERMRRRMRIANVFMRRVLNLPFKTPLSNSLMLLFYTGHKTGRSYRQPVSYVIDDDTLLTPGGGRWKYNLEDGRPITVRLRGRKVTATPELVRDPDDVERLLAVMMGAQPAADLVRALCGR